MDANIAHYWDTDRGVGDVIRLGIREQRSSEQGQLGESVTDLARYYLCSISFYLHHNRSGDILTAVNRVRPLLNEKEAPAIRGFFHILSVYLARFRYFCYIYAMTFPIYQIIYNYIGGFNEFPNNNNSDDFNLYGINPGSGE
jgi:hypothetical protein